MKQAYLEKLEELAQIRPEELVFTVVKIIDYTNDKNNRTIETRPKIVAAEYVIEFNKTADEIAKIKTAIQKHNAETLSGKICEREAIRKKINFLYAIKQLLKREPQTRRDVTRKDINNVTLETQETIIEPMFSFKEIDKMKDEFGKQERKINAEIQKLNLDKTVEL
ncbi:MAG: hypothetical protein AABW67_03615 [Nanoarchaeota archaeon]